MQDIRFFSKPYYSDSHALIIGINEYKNVAPLSYAISDADAIRDALIKNFNFPDKNIKFLTNKDATKEAILGHFSHLASEKIGIDDRILVFFAGHGYTHTGYRGEAGFLVPHDAELSNLSTLIRWQEITSISEFIHAKHMFYIMDACYGGLALNRQANPGSARFLRDMMLRYSRQVLTAGKADEVVADAGGPIPNHSVFTGHLLQGLQGNASTENGILTANGLMAYAYGKVANDKNSQQTPHYGHYDGDGDFIFDAPFLTSIEQDENKDFDRLILIPVQEEDVKIESTSQKISNIKNLLALDSSSIRLHDYMVDETRKLLSATSESFNQSEKFTEAGFIDRISKYEELCKDFALMIACIAHWAKPIHKLVLQKIIARSTDYSVNDGGLEIWRNLQWYPQIISLYCAGIAAIEGNRYDSLTDIFYTVSGKTGYDSTELSFVEAVAEKMNDYKHLFSKLPNSERLYVPLSEHLYKILQPDLDDIFFIGKSYERSFDEFEILFGLAAADLKNLRGYGFRSLIGRFGYKYSSTASPLKQILSKAKIMGESWEPLKAGLWGGSIDRFNAIAEQFEQDVAKKNWT